MAQLLPTGLPFEVLGALEVLLETIASVTYRRACMLLGCRLRNEARILALHHALRLDRAEACGQLQVREEGAFA